MGPLKPSYLTVIVKILMAVETTYRGGKLWDYGKNPTTYGNNPFGRLKCGPNLSRKLVVDMVDKNKLRST